ncbi:hypothetical protein N7541_006651 [Penicillium brevicompactum]|uniref:Uncharacterized protein n=1 Tax=Penicillium brevicompactum TaxID=5074 RepID=A0A9W9UR08_PENBR|nr:hypothetical protein N7541_006651 [Penicillium brevicompactum]
MVELSAIVAIAATVGAVFIVVSVVSIVVWVRHRKERHALALLGFKSKDGCYTKGLQSFPVDTLTELSQAEGSVLRTHGQLPYGKPTEWGQITSRESLLRPTSNSGSSFPLTEKARSLRHSLSRSRSKRLSRSSHKRFSSLATLGESSHLPSPPPKASISKEDVPLSAVEGILELPAERTPTQTPDPNDEDRGFHLGMRPISNAWPLAGPKEPSGPWCASDEDSPHAFDPRPMIFEDSPRRLRGVSIASQTAGIMPGHSIPPPPPPAAYPPDRFSYARNDSVARMSNMSLDTTNSSILDEGRPNPWAANSSFVDDNQQSPWGPTASLNDNRPNPWASTTSVTDNSRPNPWASTTSVMENSRPNPWANTTITGHGHPGTTWGVESQFSQRGFPSGGTFVPYSAADVGIENGRRSFITTNTSIPPMHNFPVRSSSTTEPRHKPVPVSPRRSMTTYHRSEASLDREVAELRRTDSLCADIPPSRHVSLRSGTPVGRRMNYSGSQMSLASQSSLVQTNTFHGNQETNIDPFYVGAPGSGTLFQPVESPSRAAKTSRPSSHLEQTNLSSKTALPSAMKGGNSQRMVKGHRRQNGVHVHINPPMTFGPTPTVEEEPDDFDDKMEELDLRESAINEPPKPPPTLPPTPMGSNSSRRGKYGSRNGNGKPSVFGSLGPLVEEPNLPTGYESPFNKRNHIPSVSVPKKPSIRDSCNLPELLTSLPPSYNGTGSGLSHTPFSQTIRPAMGAFWSPVAKPRELPRYWQPTPIWSEGSTQSTPGHRTAKPLYSRAFNILRSTPEQSSRDWRRSTSSLHRIKTNASDCESRRSRDSIASVDKDLGPIGPSSGIFGARRSSLMRNPVTIFEDDASPGWHILYPQGLTNPWEDQWPSRHAKQTSFPPRTSNVYGLPTPTSPQRGFATPKRKSMGLGIGTATPGSLYDGDGFLRE